MEGVHDSDQAVYVGEGKAGEEEFRAHGTDSLCYDQAILDVVPHDHHAVGQWSDSRVTVSAHGCVPPSDPGKLGDGQGGLQRTVRHSTDIMSVVCEDRLLPTLTSVQNEIYYISVSLKGLFSVSLGRDKPAAA